MVRQGSELGDDGRPWYAVPRSVTQRPNVRRVMSASGISGLSLTLFDLAGDQQSWLRSCIDGVLLSAGMAALLLAGRLLLAIRGRT